MKNDKITLRSEDFAKWYTDVVKAARLADYSSVKGFVILEPNGYAIWEKMQSIMDSMFKKLGHQNVYLPVLIPENMLKKEAELVEGFAPEVAWVTLGGSKKLEERLAFRPTSETLFSDYYRNTVKTYRDLPKLYNQWCSVIRWEKETRPFLRTREFLWQEGHTVHATKEEAEEETRRMLEVYKEFFESYLAIPVITGKKTEKEKFAGAEYTLTVESLMQNGVSLQSATSHYFGQKFAKNYDIKFVNKNNEFEYVYQTSWGSSTRMMGALIMSHSDDRGLVLPPKIAPKQVVIIPIKDDEELISIAEKINESLLLKRISSYIDYSDKSAGFKFAEAEVNGVPVRVEIGKRDLENDSVTLVRRDTLEKIVVPFEEILPKVKELLATIQSDMFKRAKARRDSMIYDAKTYDELREIATTKDGGFIKINWCGNESCENKIKDDFGIKSRCLIDDEEVTGPCTVCGEKATIRLYIGRQY